MSSRLLPHAGDAGVWCGMAACGASSLHAPGSPRDDAAECAARGSRAPEPLVRHAATLPAALLDRDALADRDALTDRDAALVQLEREIEDVVTYLQPVPRSEAHRNRVFYYVERLILHVSKALHLDEVYVARFGSVPLKTYLPHGDLDLTAFARDDRWMQVYR